MLTERGRFQLLNQIDFVDDARKQARIARATMCGAADFAATLQLKPTEVPCLVLLVRWTDENIVIPMEPGVRLKSIRRWLQQVMEAVLCHSRRSDELGMRLPDWSHLAELAAHAHLILPSMREKFRRTLDGLIRRHPGAVELGDPLIRTVVESRNFNAAAIQKALVEFERRIQSGGDAKLRADGRVTKLFTTLQKIREREADIHAAFDQRTSIEETRQRYQCSLEELESELRALSNRLKGSRLVRTFVFAEKLASYSPRYIRAAEGLMRVIERLSSIAAKLA